eukprot:GHVN01044841.1.p1 GENE.GHVN01044841.1~~GHVN01044841.1.p1  ORF type:complete len:245 (+),score=24.54 GHVN01044841.1:1027-1761(+)
MALDLVDERLVSKQNPNRWYANRDHFQEMGIMNHSTRSPVNSKPVRPISALSPPTPTDPKLNSSKATSLKHSKGSVASLMAHQDRPRPPQPKDGQRGNSNSSATIKSLLESQQGSWTEDKPVPVTQPVNQSQVKEKVDEASTPARNPSNYIPFGRTQTLRRNKLNKSSVGSCMSYTPASLAEVPRSTPGRRQFTATTTGRTSNMSYMLRNTKSCGGESPPGAKKMSVYKCDCLRGTKGSGTISF